MKFNESLLYRTINIPVDYAIGNCGYYWFLSLPYFILLYIVGIPMAIVIDLFVAISKAN